MRTMALSRRRFLLSGAVLGIAGTTVATSKAMAFSVEPMNAETEALYLSACQAPGAPSAYHQQVIADIMAALQGKPQTEIDARLSAATCPLCGCAIG